VNWAPVDYPPELATSRIAAAAHRLEELVENLLAYTRLGRRAVPPETVSLDRVVRSALSNMQADIVASDLTPRRAQPYSPGS
jgi:signal transduction histidine kinase